MLLSNDWQLRTAFLPYTGFTELEAGLEAGLGWSGPVPAVFTSLAQRLNFTFALRLSRDGNWGSQDPHTGHWNGAVVQNV